MMLRCYVVICLTVLLSLIGNEVIAQRKAATAPKKKASQPQLQTKLKSVNKEISNVKKQLKQKRQLAKNVKGRLVEIEGELQAACKRLEVVSNDLDKAKARQAMLARRIQETEKKLKIRQQAMKTRLRASFVLGKGSSLEAMAGSRNIRELLSRGDALRRITQADNKLFNEVKTLKAMLVEDKREQDALVAKTAGLKHQRETQKSQLDAVHSEKRELLSQIRHDEHLLAEQLEELERESATIEQTLKALYASPNYKNRGIKYNGKLLLPNAVVTSNYGMRMHPIAKKVKMHTGVDYGMPYGAAIHSADDGVVVYAGTMRGYGNTIIVDHGGGISTLYAHCSALIAFEGQTVKRGDTIAKVGSTGYSTGPHLHFEVRKNGKPVNPFSAL